jgi:Flp pilus assembly protein TadB
MIDANTKVLTTANTQLRRNMVFTVVAGVLFVFLGVSFGYHSPPGIIFVALGVAFFLRGVFSYTRAARYPAADKPV